MKTYDYLLSYGIKPSVQRLAIMDYLLSHLTHPSIDEIYTALCEKIPTLSKTTVYNTLKLFVEHGAAMMLTIDEKNVCYDAEVKDHAHFFCKECNKIYDLPLQLHTQERIKNVEAEGFQVDMVQEYYRGICPHCQAAKERQAN